jgi:hypothetical protein
MLDHDEFRQTRSAICDHWNDGVMQDARQIVNERLSEPTTLDLIRLQ